MPLNLPANFERDIQSKDTSIYPFVLIDDGNLNIRLSTNAITIGTDFHKPLLLNIPSLKESIDIEKRNYKISSVTLDISNYEYEGVRFSDLIGNSSLINKGVLIYWGSQTTVDYDSAFQIYNGTVRRYTHDDEKVKLVVEDRSQATLHKDLPIADLGTGSDVPDKYKNKPIPMVYGHVDRSPCVMRTKMSEGDPAKTIEIISDSVSVNAYHNDDKWNNIYNKSTNSLWNFRNDVYFNVKRDSQGDYSYANSISAGYAYDYPNYIESESTGTILLEPKYDENGNARNATGDNILETDIIRIPQAFNIAGENYSFYPPYDARNIVNHTMDAAVFFEESISDFYFTPLIMLPIWRSLSENDVALVRHFSLHNIMSYVMASNENDVGYAYFQILYDYDFSEFGDRVFKIPSSPSQMIYGIQVDSNNMHDHTYTGANVVENKSITDYEIGDSGDNGYNSGYWSKYSLTPPSFLKYKYTAGGVYNIGVNANIRGFGLYQKVYFNKVDEGDFYANVNGRKSGEPKAPVMIEDILKTELGSDANITLPSGYDDWKYAFTVDKKINSKKLIENIASASPYLPRFNNMGDFKFDTITRNGQPESDDILYTIKESDVIQFSYSRTKIEDVYSKIVFKHNWDYARGEFNDSVIADTSLLGVEEDDSSVDLYKHEYYGFTKPSTDQVTLEEIHPDSTLVIDDDRGKYIRNPETAKYFAEWFLLWSCNQHLKMKIKLPLKYMDLEIGDIVDFDDILGGVMPYGIDYTNPDIIKVNGQQVFNTFLITSTNKTLEWVEVECIQMHNLLGFDYDCAGNLIEEGVTSSYIDVCGQCVTEDVTYGDCACGDIPFGDCDCYGNVLDECGVCGGGNASMNECGICDGEYAECMPTVWAGSNQTVSVGLEATLHADAEACPAGCDEDWEARWEQISGTPVDLFWWVVEGGEVTNYPLPDVYQSGVYDNFGNFLNPNFTPSNIGMLTFKLSITSQYGTEESFVQVSVIEDVVGLAHAGYPSGVYTTCDSNNDPEQNSETPCTLILDGSESQNVASQVWTVQSCEGSAENCDLPVVIDDPTALTTFFTAPQVDANTLLIFTLEITDTEGIVHWDTVEKLVSPTEECPNQIGDLNGDAGWNVLDIVMLSNCVLDLNCNDLIPPNYGCAGDVNRDGGHNVLDIVALANCVIDDTCSLVN